MRKLDRSYYEERAEAEIEAAHAACHPLAARAHYLLAAHYLDLAHNPDSLVNPGSPVLVATESIVKSAAARANPDNQPSMSVKTLSYLPT
jgi:hypothetical protein